MFNLLLNILGLLCLHNLLFCINPATIELYVQPKDIWPPEEITDLTAELGTEEGSVKLIWTAPEEDKGIQDKLPVSKYIIKYATFSINSLLGDTTRWWDSSHYVMFPAVKKPGEKETYIIKNLAIGNTWYFAIKSVDESENISDIDKKASTGQQAYIYLPLPKNYTISGRVTDEKKCPLSKVEVKLVEIIAGGHEEVISSVLTSEIGEYEFTNVLGGKNYIVRLSKPGWTFTPKVSMPFILNQDTRVDFTASSTEKIIVEFPKPPLPDMPPDAKFHEFTLPNVGDIKIAQSDSNDPKWVNSTNNEKVYVIFKGNKSGKFTLRVVNLVGELVYGPITNNFDSSAGYFEWLPKNIPSGTYILHIEGSGINKFKKIVILR